MSPTVDGTFIDPNQIGEGELSGKQHIYKENILDHYRNPRNKKHLDGATHTAHDKNPLCGDTITMHLSVQKGTIQDIAFEGTGCAISQASASMLTRKLKGMSVEDVRNLGQDFVLDMLGIPIGVVRRKCAMLGLRVVQQAVGDV